MSVVTEYICEDWSTDVLVTSNYSKYDVCKQKKLRDFCTAC